MSDADSQPAKFRVLFTKGTQVSMSDTTPDKEGANHGFWSHELLEAALESVHLPAAR